MTRLHQARAAAHRLLHAFGVTQPAHIDIEAIARYAGATLFDDSLEGATARLMRVRGKAVIRVSDRTTNPGARRFSIAHELGHLVLGHRFRAIPRHVNPERFLALACERRRGHAVDIEVEANTFGAESLMPAPMVHRHCDLVRGADLSSVRAIADTFRTSLVASAVRFAELTHQPCAVVFSVDGRIKWAVPSLSFGAPIQRGQHLHPASVAAAYFGGHALAHDAQPVPSFAWDQGARGPMYEHAAALDDLRAVLSLVWRPTLR
jgi:Zn-dependent peptidase ImmA (M78 family)